MPKKLNRIMTCLLITMGFIVVSQSMLAQGLPCFPDAKGSYYTAPYSNYTPVLYTDMPYDIMISYIIADSIISNCTQNYVQTISNKIGINSDTLKYGLKYLYKIADYNPILYHSFLNTAQSSKLQPYRVLEELDKRLVKENTTNADIINELVSAFYILRVYVTNTQKIKDGPLSYTVVHCNVLDTIKGQVIPDINNAMVIDDEVSGDKISFPYSADLIFEYTNNFLRSNRKTSTTMYRNGNPLIMPDNEYIVFLKHVGTCTYQNTTYYTLSPVMKNFSAGMFSIESGDVLDEGNDFGWGTSVPVTVFINNLRNAINDIVTFGD